MSRNLNFYKELFNRSWLLYAALVASICFSPNHVKLLANAKAETLSRLTPPLDYIDSFINTNEKFDKKKLSDCIYYHHRVIDIIPTYRADAYAMLGFCHERAGQYAKAIDSYQRSLKYNPSFFWTYYNLGAIYYNQKHYDKARDYFERATEQDAMRASMIPMMSKVYKDVVAGHVPAYDVPKSLARGYQMAFVYLLSSSQQMHDYPFMLTAAIKTSQRGRPGDEIFLYYGGVAAYEMKLFDKALILFQQFLSAFPMSAEGMRYLGLTLQGMGQEDAAREFLSRAEHMARQGAPSPLPDLSRAPVQFY